MKGILSIFCQALSTGGSGGGGGGGVWDAGAGASAGAGSADPVAAAPAAKRAKHAYGNGWTDMMQST